MVADVLANIIAHKRREVATRKNAVPLEQFQSLAPSERSLAQALRENGNRFILEYKRASPSKGQIRPGFTPEQCVTAYHACADAYSVLTDETFFGGHHRLLKQVSQLDTKPVLCKDFFVDIYQVYEARFYGADAVLLMLSVLSDDDYQQLYSIAQKLNLDVLTEVHSEEECARAIALKAPIIGINNRDLRDLSTRLSVTEKLASRIPNDRIVISESGINSRADINRLAKHVDGFLIGSSLMQAIDVGHAARQLVYGSVKICGIKTIDVARACVEAGADYLGLMRYAKSTRYVSRDDAQSITTTVAANYVGVFVDQTIEFIIDDVKELGLRVVQLHGAEDTTFINTLKQQLPDDIEIWKAVHVDSEASLETIEKIQKQVNRVVLDYRVGDELGGTGQGFDWSLLRKIFEQVDESKVVIAGGVNKDNLSELVNYTDSIIDLSSGVEVTKGEKDIQRIKAFFQQCRMNGIEQTDQKAGKYL